MSRWLFCYLVIAISLCSRVAIATINYPPLLKPVLTFSGNAERLNSFGYMAIDDRGKLCVASRVNGVACFDGLRIETVYNDAAMSLMPIATDTGHALHFATRHGIYALSNGQVRKVLFNEDMGFTTKEHIISLHLLHEPDKNQYLFSTTSGLYRYDNQKVTKLFNYTSHQYTYFVRRQPGSPFYELGTNKGLLVVDATGVLQQKSFLNTRVRYLLDGLVLTSRGLYLHDENHLLKKGNFSSAFKRKNGQILITGNHGLCSYNKSKLTCPKNSANAVKTLYEDKYLNLWAITDHGLQVAKRSAIQTINQQLGLVHNKVVALAEHKGRIYIGTPDGINVYDARSEKISLLEGSLGHSVRAMLFVGEQLWMASKYNGVYRYNDNTRRFDQVLKTTDLVVALALFQNKVWAATQLSGIYQLDLEGRLLEKELYPAFSRITKMSVCDNHLLIATKRNGLIALDDDGKLADYTNKMPYPVFDCNGSSITASTGNKILIAEGSVSHLDSRDIVIPAATTVFSLFTYKNALWSVQDNGIFQVAQNEVLLKENQWLTHVYPNTYVVQDEWLFIGSARGLLVIRMDTLHDFPNRVAAPPEILTNSDNINGILSVDITISDLASVNDHNFYWQYPGDADFRPVNHSIVFAGDINANAITIKAEHINGDVKLKTVTVASHSSQKGGSVFFNARNGSDKSVKYYTLVVLSFLLLVALFSISLYYFSGRSVVFTMGRRKENKPLEYVEEVTAGHIFVPDRVSEFAKLVESIKHNPDCRKDKSRRLVKFLNILTDNPDLRNKKVYQAVAAAELEDANLRTALNSVFGSHKLGEFIRAFYYYLDTQDRTKTNDETRV